MEQHILEEQQILKFTKNIFNSRLVRKELSQKMGLPKTNSEKDKFGQTLIPPDLMWTHNFCKISYT